ncbi:LOW QUALITY PROTEIN: E3 ubiquitin-protein ligase WAV3-like [Primulina tabacum]|uniref:LOW QUALITY PROTEIN: E3 ubiquitin-protein ligase WAV3-like n=1 Tax=Primulina tabacum TaxID=48773 RepID=UPI003F5A0D9E
MVGSGWRRAFGQRKEAIHGKTENHITSNSKSPTTISASNPSSPRSPFSVFKNTLRLSRAGCGVCMQSVRTCQGMAIYTAECFHAFHFPCIASHVRKQDALVCPVCNIIWKDVPLLSTHNQHHDQNRQIPTNNNPISSSKYTDQGCFKSYADDEPLVSPKFDHYLEGSRLTESDEFQEVQEFQGFFMNHISSSDDTFSSIRESRNVEVSLLPEAAVICLGQTYVVVLKIKAPPPPPPPLSTAFLRRAPIDLVTVLNGSGRMGGTKLQTLKRTMHLVISSLGPADRLSVVAFATTPKRLMPLMRMTAQGQRSARRIVDRLSCRHGSSMGEALKQATIVLQDRRERNPVASIMLLSDGQDDISTTDNDTTQQHGSSHVSSTRFSHIELSINSSHKATEAGISHEPAEEAFSKFLGGLLSVVVHDLTIQLSFATGSDPAEILGVYSGNGHPTLLDSRSVKVGNLYAEEERQLYIELRVPHSNLRSQHCVLSVSCSHKDPATQEVTYVGDHALLVPKPHDVQSGVPKVEHLRYSFISTRAVAESRRLIEYDELCSAMQLLSSARSLLLQSRSESALELVRVLEAELAEVQCRQLCKEAKDAKKPVNRGFDDA